MKTIDGVVTVLNHGLDRSFTNLFSILFTAPEATPPVTNLSSRMRDLTYYAEKLTFGGDFTFDTEYSEATKQFFIKNAQRIKTATIIFRETSKYKVVDVLKDWMDNIYNFKENYFYKWNPLGIIDINLDAITDDVTTTGRIRLEGTFPTTLSYPAYDWADGNPIKINSNFNCTDVSFRIPS